MINTSNNPFSQDCSNFLYNEQNRFKKSKKDSVESYISNNYNKKNNQFNIFAIFQNHLVPTLSLMVFLFSGLTAQAFAPESYKPSTIIQSLFSANTADILSPNQYLKPDQNNEVVLADQCNILMKYPVGDANNRNAYQPTDDGNYKVFNITNPNKNITTIVDLTCKKIGENIIKNNIISNPNYEISNPSKEDLQNQNGWFITTEDIKNIQTTKSPSGNSQYIFFDYNDLTFSVMLQNDFIKSNNIQLQLVDQVENKFAYKDFTRPEFENICLKYLNISYNPDRTLITSENRFYSTLDIQYGPIDADPELSIPEVETIQLSCNEEKSDTSVYPVIQAADVPFLTDNFKSEIKEFRAQNNNDTVKSIFFTDKNNINYWLYSLNHKRAVETIQIVIDTK